MANVGDIIDVHTHLFPPRHGSLLLWGVDEVLTYHYLIAETCSYTGSAEDFYALSKKQQAELVWDELFVKRCPVSEATVGVLTYLRKLELPYNRQTSDLQVYRDWFAKQNIDDYIEKVFSLAGVSHAIMTNNPFVDEEANHWKEGKPGHPRLITALRIDPFIEGTKENLDAELKRVMERDGKSTVEDWLEYWFDLLKPVYLMARCKHFPQEFPKIMTDFSEKHNNLPLALKIGCDKAINPPMKEAGDAVVTTQLAPLGKLLREFPKIKVLATVLSYNNQHELAVLSRKFPNLHVYGCWWFCNNPSLVAAITKMRLEMLGHNFTAQHSDARVLDHLIYKWDHSNKIVRSCVEERKNWNPLINVDETMDWLFRGEVRAFLGNDADHFFADPNTKK